MDAAIPASELALLQQIATIGSKRAAEALGMFSGNSLTVNGAQASLLTLEHVPFLQGNPEEVVVGVDFSIEGDITGYLLAFFHMHDASVLLESLLGESVTQLADIGEMQLSALGEAGNIIVSSFLSSLEGLCGLNAMPSPPSVAVDMCGAILTSAVLPIVEMGGEVLMIQADITPADMSSPLAASCRILFLPTPESWALLHKAIASFHPA